MHAKGTKHARESAAVSDCTKISCIRKVGEPRIRKLSAYEIFWIYSMTIQKKCSALYLKIGKFLMQEKDPIKQTCHWQVLPKTAELCQRVPCPILWYLHFEVPLNRCEDHISHCARYIGRRKTCGWGKNKRQKDQAHIHENCSTQPIANAHHGSKSAEGERRER